LSLQPVSVALKFGFIAVMFLFLLWVSRSALRDLRRPSGPAAYPPAGDATGFHPAAGGPRNGAPVEPRLVVERAPGHDPGMIYDLEQGAVLGRGDAAEIRLEDPFASGAHARVYLQGNVMVIEDLDSTNGTYLNEELLDGPRPLHPGDRVRIGDSEFTYDD
jgi:hypothetical protein